MSHKMQQFSNQATVKSMACASWWQICSQTDRQAGRRCLTAKNQVFKKITISNSIEVFWMFPGVYRVFLTWPNCSPASPCLLHHWMFSWPGCLHGQQGAGSSLCRPASPGVQSARTHPCHKAERLQVREVHHHDKMCYYVGVWSEPDGQSSIAQGFGCATRGDQRQTHIHQPSGEVH